MTKDEFEKNGIPYSMIVTIHPTRNERVITFFEGYNIDGFVKQCKIDWPEQFTFGKLNKAAVNLRNKELFDMQVG